ncbi:response regulator transcription factor [Neobacillus ginsengisoli]|uniref:Two-component system response regulator YesN n=1 Tax=Neobacillus ginsengisoli TaxID=904295 RepID=A0ABT9Y135_9BACI|nr:response regulator transcription factor [Neobacillus ginsengisoli]MDQ0201543.1 two-component system response regulator YesN [Neobacillus ginsengisoli]
MLKILIVDDEVLERKGLAKIITDSIEDVMVIGEAANGRRAIEMALEHRPDIIFMDIKMPGIDGVQAVKEIKKIDPAIRFIMVSAFNTFEYAKEVMQQGVKEYILKPSRKQDILEALERVSFEIEGERKQRDEQQSLRENLNRAVSIAQKEWVSSLLINQVQDITFDEWGQLLGVEITSGYIMLFSLQPKEKSELSASDKLNWYAWLKDALKSNVKKQEIMVGPITETQVPVLFLCKKTAEKIHFKSYAGSIIETIHTLIQKQFSHAELRIGVGLPYNHAHELNKSYHEAVLALQKLQLTPKQKFLFGVKLGAAEITPADKSGILEMEKKLLDAVRMGDVTQVMFLFDSFINGQATIKNIDPHFVKKSFDELFVLLSRMLHDLGVPYERKPVIDESETMASILETGKVHLMSIVQQVQTWRNNHAKGMLHKAKEYIENHYAESITLELVAEYVELSPFYFSKLFKDRFGMTFIDYLTEIRIKHAKAQMEDQAKSLKEICFSIGYNDPNYFSRVFKKLTGLSPTEYRKAT